MQMLTMLYYWGLGIIKVSQWVGLQKFFIGHNTKDIPYNPALRPHRHRERSILHGGKGQVLVVVHRSNRGSVEYRYPTVYFYHEDGMVIAMHIGWSQNM